MARAGFSAVLCLLAVLAPSPSGWAGEPWTGPRIQEELFRRQLLLAAAYEEQSLILKDRSGERNVRKLRRYLRVEEDGTVRLLLVFDTPSDVRGVALLKTDRPSGRGETWIYLPALGKGLLTQAGNAWSGPFLGTDYTIGDLTGEAPADFRYERVADQRVELAPCYVVEVTPRDEETERRTGYGLRRHFIRQDTFRPLRTDYYDRRKRFLKRQTFHDPVRVQGDLWQANMSLMENHRERHETLIKTDRRVISRDYVPPELFTAARLLENRHIQGAERRLSQKDLPFSKEGEETPPEASLPHDRQARTPGENR